MAEHLSCARSEKKGIWPSWEEGNFKAASNVRKQSLADSLIKSFDKIETEKGQNQYKKDVTIKKNSFGDYSQTCVQRTPSGPHNSGHCWQVGVVQR